jgi:uncharacterized protein (DUF302 family)
MPAHRRLNATVGHMARHLMRAFDEVVRMLPVWLEDEGFCVLGDMDLEQMLADTLGVQSRRYRIFSTCHPSIVERALTAEPDVGPRIPCNVAVYEGDQGETVVEMLDPVVLMNAGDHSRDVHSAAQEAHKRLSRVLSRL